MNRQTKIRLYEKQLQDTPLILYIELLKIHQVVSDREGKGADLDKNLHDISF